MISKGTIRMKNTYYKIKSDPYNSSYIVGFSLGLVIVTFFGLMIGVG